MRRLRGVLVEGGAAQPRPNFSGLHPDSQRPPSLPPPWIGGLGSAGPLGEIVAKRRPTEEKLDGPSKVEDEYTPTLRLFFRLTLMNSNASFLYIYDFKRSTENEAKQNQLIAVASHQHHILVVEENAPCCRLAEL